MRKKRLFIMVNVILFITLFRMDMATAEADNFFDPNRLISADANQKVTGHGESSSKALNFGRDSKKALEWSNKNYPMIGVEWRNNPIIENVDMVNSVLEKKYLNRSDLYEDQEELDYLDSLLVTEAGEDVVLYGYYSGESFNLAKGTFDSAYDHYLSSSRYGIENGYFMGGLTSRKLQKKEEPTGEMIGEQYVMERVEEKIEIELTVPKGTKMVRVGSENGGTFILSRELAFEYVEKSLVQNRQEKYVNIKTKIIDPKIIMNKADQIEMDLGKIIENSQENSGIKLKVLPLGLNCDYMLSNAHRILDVSIKSNGWKQLLEEERALPYELTFSDYGYVNSDMFRTNTQNQTLTEQMKTFNDDFSLEEDGITFKAADFTWSESNIKVGRTLPITLMEENPIEYISGVVLHEVFHYIEYNSNKFLQRKMFKESDYSKIVNHVKEKESGGLEAILQNPYCTENAEEYMAEAFMAKYHPIKPIRDKLPSIAPMTNRLIENLFDSNAPTAPVNLKETDIEGELVSLMFNHSEDDIGVLRYNIYQNGVLIDSIDTKKDSLGLSYPKPGEHQEPVKTRIEGLTQYTDYEFYITALDEAQNESEKSNVLKVKTKDIEPPQVNELFGSAMTSAFSRLHWRKPTDNVGVDKIKIVRQEKSDKGIMKTGDKTYTISGDATSYTDFTIEKGKQYTYYMTALDEAGNESEKSNSIVIQTSDEDDRKQNEDKAQDVSSESATLNWSGFFSVPAKGFKIFGWIFSIFSGWTIHSETYVERDETLCIVDLKPDQAHLFLIVPIDEEDNPVEDILKISVDAKYKPEAPTNLKVANITDKSMELTWQSMEDPSLVTGFEIYRNGQLVHTTDKTARQYTILNLNPDTEHTFSIKTKTTKGTSPHSNVINGKTLPAPKPPTELKVIDTTNNSITLSWQIVGDQSLITGFEIYKDGQLIHTTDKHIRDYRVTNLRSNTNYSFSFKTKTTIGTSPFSIVINGKTLPTLIDFPAEVHKALNMVYSYIKIIDEDIVDEDTQKAGDFFKAQYLLPAKYLFEEYMEDNDSKKREEALFYLYEFQCRLDYKPMTTPVYWLLVTINRKRDFKEDFRWVEEFIDLQWQG